MTSLLVSIFPFDCDVVPTEARTLGEPGDRHTYGVVKPAGPWGRVAASGHWSYYGKKNHKTERFYGVLK